MLGEFTPMIDERIKTIELMEERIKAKQEEALQTTIRTLKADEMRLQKVESQLRLVNDL